MKTECTLQDGSFRFTVTGQMGNKYELQIEQGLPWAEEITAYGMLCQEPEGWMLKDMTFENAHDECVLASFFLELYKIKAAAYPEAVKYYEANRQPDIF